MTKQPRTNDFDLRILVTRALLNHGIPREAIRHEITLDTSSSDGRADMVVALDRELIGIEIKSGKDKLDRLQTQRDQYRRRFDRMCLVLDARHLPKDEVIRESRGGGSWSEYRTLSQFMHRLNFGGIAIAKDGSLDGTLHSYDDLPWGPKSGWRRRYGPDDKQAPGAMLSMLWASEVSLIAARLVTAGHVPAGASGGTRCRLIPHLAEHAPIAKLRPLIAEMLRTRQLNRWEESFWAKFDAQGVEEAA